MGLDISAFKAATFVRAKKPREDGDEEYPRLTFLHVNPDFPERADGMIDGLYDVGGSPYGGPAPAEGTQYRFRAGSYSGYNMWRDWLSRTMRGVGTHEITPGPFYELIWFSDCEGIIGPKTCAKLAADFAAHADKAIPDGSIDSHWAVERYADWRKAFKLASNGGCVEFH